MAEPMLPEVAPGLPYPERAGGVSLESSGAAVIQNLWRRNRAADLAISVTTVAFGWPRLFGKGLCDS
jgi:hypothetical protein